MFPYIKNYFVYTRDVSVQPQIVFNFTTSLQKLKTMQKICFDSVELPDTLLNCCRAIGNTALEAMLTRVKTAYRADVLQVQAI